MSRSLQTLSPNNPNAPQIQKSEYIVEKACIAGSAIGAIGYGIVIVLFFQCMNALLNSVDRTQRPIKWPLVAHTVTMFSLVTVYTGMYLSLQSVSYVGNREFPGTVNLPPGPTAYQGLIYSDAISLIPRVMFLLNNWLADGLLLYRCCVIFSMNYCAIAFPFLMYLVSFTTGVVLIYLQVSEPDSKYGSPGVTNTGISYFSISVSLNVLLTLMIIARLVLHNREIRDAMDPLFKPSRLYNAIVTTLIESSAPYAVTFLVFLGAWATSNPAQFIFFPIVAQTQVIAPFFIILRAANRTALTSDAVSGNTDPIRFDEDRTGDSRTFSGEHLGGFDGTVRKDSSSLGDEVI